MKFPKVLILEQPFDNQTGGGITLTNLFSGWDCEKIAVVCSGYLVNENTNFDVCNKYYQIGALEHKWQFPFNLFKRKYYSGPIRKKANHPTTFNKNLDSTSLRTKSINYIFYPVLNYFGLNHVCNKLELSDELCNWLDNYDPEIIYAQPSSIQSTIFCRIVQAYLKRPMIIHMMDDWPSMIKGNSLFGSYWYNRVNIEINKLFDNTSLFFSISELMAEEYLIRYNRKFFAFHNPIDIPFWKRHRRSDYNIGYSPTLLYAGRIGIGIDSSLQNIAKAVTLVNDKYKINLSFKLQTPEFPNWIYKYKYTSKNEFVEYSLLPKVFAEADLLILPYDFSLKSVQFIRLSMPTKAPEYLASGTAVIVFAPDETALVKYVKKNNCALAVTNNNVELLAEKIAELLSDEYLRKRFGVIGTELVDKFHDAETVRNQFRILLTSLME